MSKYTTPTEFDEFLRSGNDAVLPLRIKGIKEELVLARRGLEVRTKEGHVVCWVSGGWKQFRRSLVYEYEKWLLKHVLES